MLLPAVASLSYLVVLSTGVAASPIVDRDSQAPISLPITKTMNPTDRIDVVQSDRGRLRNLANAATGDQFDASALDETADVPLDYSVSVYTINVGVGIPPKYSDSFRFLPRMVSHTSVLDNLIVDTGSANTWVGAHKPYKKSCTSVKTGNSVVNVMSHGFLASSN